MANTAFMWSGVSPVARAVGIPCRAVGYPQRGTLAALNATDAGAPVLGVGAGSASAYGFDGKVWVEFYAAEHGGWSYLAANPGAAINSTDNGALAFDKSIVNSSAGVFSVWASDWRPNLPGESCAVCSLPPCCNSFRFTGSWTDATIPATEVTSRYIASTEELDSSVPRARRQRERAVPALPSAAAALAFLKAHRPAQDVA